MLHNALPLFAVLICLTISRGVLLYINNGNYGEHRYYLVLSIIFIVLLSVSGDLIKKHSHSIIVKSCLFLFIATICIITGYIVYPRKQKTFLKDFAQAITLENGKQSVLIDFSGDGIRIAQKVPGLKLIPLKRKSAEDLEYHESIEFFFPGLLFEYDTIWFLTSKKEDDASKMISIPNEKVLEYKYRKHFYTLSKIDCGPQRKYINVSMPREICFSSDIDRFRIDFSTLIPDTWNKKYIEVKTPYGKCYNTDWLLNVNEMQEEMIPWEVICYSRSGMPFARAFTWLRKTSDQSAPKPEYIVPYPSVPMPEDCLEPYDVSITIPEGKKFPPVSLAGILGWNSDCSRDIDININGADKTVAANDTTSLMQESPSFVQIKYASKTINVFLNPVSKPQPHQQKKIVIIAGNTLWWGPLEDFIKKRTAETNIKLISDHVFSDYLLDCRKLLMQNWSSITQNPFYDNTKNELSIEHAIADNKPDALLIIPGAGSLMYYPDPFLIPESKGVICEQKREIDKLIELFRKNIPDIKVGITTFPNDMFTNETCGLFPGKHTPRTMDFRRNEFNQMLMKSYMNTEQMIDVIPMHAYQWPVVDNIKRKDSYEERMIDHSFWPLSDSRVQGFMSLIDYWLSQPNGKSFTPPATTSKTTDEYRHFYQ